LSWRRRKEHERGGSGLALTTGEKRGRTEVEDWKKIEGVGWGFLNSRRCRMQ